MDTRKEEALMSEEQFKEALAKRREKIVEDAQRGILPLRYFQAVSKFKSIGRAYRRGHISLIGEIYPKRPFNNRANTSKHSHSRAFNELKKSIYEQYKAAV